MEYDPCTTNSESEFPKNYRGYLKRAGYKKIGGIWIKPKPPKEEKKEEVEVKYIIRVNL